MRNISPVIVEAVWAMNTTNLEIKERTAGKKIISM